jgi:hypothetical protein
LSSNFSNKVNDMLYMFLFAESPSGAAKVQKFNRNLK